MLDGFRVSEKQNEFRGIELLRIEPLQGDCDFQPHAHSPNRGAVRDAHVHTAAALSAVRAADGNEGLRYETNSRKMALIKSRGNFFTINPRRAKLFERCLRTSANGDARVLQDFNARVEDGTLGGAQIRRWWNPLDTRAFKKVVAMPVLHGDHVQVRADVIFDVEELRELADGQSVPHGQGKISHEIRFVRVQHR